MNFDEVIEQYGIRIFRYCFHMLRHKQEAEDAAQDIFIKAYEKYDHLKDKRVFGPWLYKTAYRHCLNIIRRKKLLSFVSIFDSTLEEARGELQYEPSINADVTAILNRLSPADRTIIYLKVLENKSHDEIACIMDISNAAARKQYERAKNRAKKLFIIESEGSKNEKISII